MKIRNILTGKELTANIKLSVKDGKVEFRVYVGDEPISDIFKNYKDISFKGTSYEVVNISEEDLVKFKTELLKLVRSEFEDDRDLYDEEGIYYLMESSNVFDTISFKLNYDINLSQMIWLANDNIIAIESWDPLTDVLDMNFWCVLWEYCDVLDEVPELTPEILEDVVR